MNAATEHASPPATAPRQRSKPMLSLRGVMALVDKDKNRVSKLIESGDIAWAFECALAPKDGRKRELRVLPAAVADYLKGRACELKWADVFALLLPAGPTISASQISRILNVTSDHVYHLIDGKKIVACSTSSLSDLTN